MPLCCGSNQVANDDEKTSPNIVNAVERHCTDVLCFLLFIVMWCLWIILAILAFTDGCGSDSGCNTPMRLVYGYDSQGNQCGSGDLSEMKTMFVGNPADAVNAAEITAFTIATMPIFSLAKLMQTFCERLASKIPADASDAAAGAPSFALRRARGGSFVTLKSDSC